MIILSTHSRTSLESNQVVKGNGTKENLYIEFKDEGRRIVVNTVSKNVFQRFGNFFSKLITGKDWFFTSNHKCAIEIKFAEKVLLEPKDIISVEMQAFKEMIQTIEQNNEVGDIEKFSEIIHNSSKIIKENLQTTVYKSNEAAKNLLATKIPIHSSGPVLTTSTSQLVSSHQSSIATTPIHEQEIEPQPSLTPVSVLSRIEALQKALSKLQPTGADRIRALIKHREKEYLSIASFDSEANRSVVQAKEKLKDFSEEALLKLISIQHETYEKLKGTSTVRLPNDNDIITTLQGKSLVIVSKLSKEASKMSASVDEEANVLKFLKMQQSLLGKTALIGDNVRLFGELSKNIILLEMIAEFTTIASQANAIPTHQTIPLSPTEKPSEVVIKKNSQSEIIHLRESISRHFVEIETWKKEIPEKGFDRFMVILAANQGWYQSIMYWSAKCSAENSSEQYKSELEECEKTFKILSEVDSEIVELRNLKKGEGQIIKEIQKEALELASHYKKIDPREYLKTEKEICELLVLTINETNTNEYNDTISISNFRRLKTKTATLQLLLETIPKETPINDNANQEIGEYREFVRKQQDKLGGVEGFYGNISFEGARAELTKSAEKIAKLQAEYTLPPERWLGKGKEVRVESLHGEQLVAYRDFVSESIRTEQVAIEKLMQPLLNAHENFQLLLEICDRNIETYRDSHPPQHAHAYALRRAVELAKEDLIDKAERYTNTKNLHGFTEQLKHARLALDTRITEIDNLQKASDMAAQLKAVPSDSREATDIRKRYIEDVRAQIKIYQEIRSEKAKGFASIADDVRVADSLVKKFQSMSSQSEELLKPFKEESFTFLEGLPGFRREVAKRVDQLDSRQLSNFQMEAVKAMHKSDNLLLPLFSSHTRAVKAQHQYEKVYNDIEARIDDLRASEQYIEAERLEKSLVQARENRMELVRGETEGLDSIEKLNTFSSAIGKEAASMHSALEESWRYVPKTHVDQLRGYEKDHAVLSNRDFVALREKLMQEVTNKIDAAVRSIDDYADGYRDRIKDLSPTEVGRVEEVIANKKRAVENLKKQFVYTSPSFPWAKKTIAIGGTMTSEELGQWEKVVSHEKDRIFRTLEKSLGLKELTKAIELFEDSLGKARALIDELSKRNPPQIYARYVLEKSVKEIQQQRMDIPKLSIKEYAKRLYKEEERAPGIFAMPSLKYRLDRAIGEVQDLELENQLQKLPQQSPEYQHAFNLLLSKKRNDIEEHVKILTSWKTHIEQMATPQLNTVWRNRLIKMISDNISEVKKYSNQYDIGTIRSNIQPLENLTTSQVIAFAKNLDLLMERGWDDVDNAGIVKAEKAEKEYQKQKALFETRLDELRRQKHDDLASVLQNLYDIQTSRHDVAAKEVSSYWQMKKFSKITGEAIGAFMSCIIHRR